MLTIGRLLLALALAAAVTAVWIPQHWIQFLITAVLLFVPGATLVGNKTRS